MAITRLGPNNSTNISGINLTSQVTGTLPTANGGTGATSFAAGKVLQVVTGVTYTSTTSTSSTYADTSLTASITPSATSSKILIMVNQFMRKNQTNTYIGYKLFRDSTQLDFIGDIIAYTQNSDSDANGIGTTYLDTPSSTSSITYKTQFATLSGGTITIQADSASSTERGRGSMTLMEIAG
tara:strand:- start:150 stop:695 length:546 start_codon:yes stop_codon:yes gene_type:complete